LLRIAAEADEFVFATVATQFGLTQDEPFEEWREQELLALEGGPNETPGHSDRFRYWPRVKLAAIIDKKFGYKVVTPAAANHQLRVYAIGAYAATDAENVVVAITQPRLSYYERVTMASYTAADIEASKVELAAIREASRQPNAPLHAGEDQCRYCRAKTKCPEFTRQLVPLDQGKELKARLPELTPAQRDGLIRAVKFADYIKESLMDNEREVIATGGESLYTLGKAKEVRHVTDVKRAVAFLALRGDITRDQALDCCEMSIGDNGGVAEKIRLNRKCTWKDAREIVDKTLESVIERKTQRAPLTRIKEKLLT
jgi:hypothetical protein